MKFPVFSLLAGNFGLPETSSLLTASSTKESAANLTSSIRARPGVMGSRFCAARHYALYRVAVSAPSRILLCSSLPAGSSARHWHEWEESHELVTS
jgi:hypothetical protein